MGTKKIEISSELMYLTWNDRQPGEETEEEIWTRWLEGSKKHEKCGRKNYEAREISEFSEDQEAGLFEGQSRVFLPEGFQVFTYYAAFSDKSPKKRYAARVAGNQWECVDSPDPGLLGQKFNSLMDFNRSYKGHTGSPWRDYWFTNKGQKPRQIDSLRSRRSTRRATLTRIIETE